MAMSHNAKLRNLIDAMSVASKESKTEADLVSVAQLAKQFSGPLEYDNTLLYLTTFLSALFLFALYFFVHVEPVTGLKDISIFLFIAGAFGFIVPIVLAYSRDNSIATLFDDIVRKDALFDNQLNIIEIVDDSHSAELAKALEASFYEFDRGNYSREVKGLYEGVFHYNGRDLPYEFFHFHYVDSRTVTELVSDGKGGTKISTRTVYDHYDRFGIIISFPYAKNISIFSKDTAETEAVRYRPASNKFNDIFSAYSDSELLLSKFLKPTVVLAFEKMSEDFDAVNIEINKDAMLCFSVDNDDLVSADYPVNAQKDPGVLIEHILQKQQLPKLALALSHIGTLMKYSDNNFSEK